MSSVSCDQNSSGPLSVQPSVQKRRSGSVVAGGPSERLEPSSPLSETVVVRPGAKRRIRSAGPRLELGNSAETGEGDAGAVVVRPCLSPPVSPFQRPLHSEDAGGRESNNANKKYHLVITRCEAQPLEEALNLSASISPNLHFRGLDSLLQQPSPRPPNDPTQEALTISPPPSQGRLLVLDPAVGVPAQETVSRLTEDGSAQSPPRIVSVKREECMKKEHAAMFLGQDRAAKQHRTVTVSRSNTWSFDGRGTGPRTPGSRPLPASSNCSILGGGGRGGGGGGGEGGGSLTDHNKSAVVSDEVLAENTEEELDRDDTFEWNSFRPLGRSKTQEPKKSCILRSNSVQLSSARKRQSQEGMRIVSWLDIEPDAKIGLLSRDGVRGHGEAVKEEEPMDSKSREEGVNLPDGGPMIHRCVIFHRDEKGFGFTVCGDNPVLVENVKLNGAAYRAGVRKDDQIVKVNGTQVLNCNHTEVVKLIKSGSYVALTLLGHQPVAATKALETLEQSSPIGTPAIPSLIQEKGKISSPLAVDHDKDLQFKAQRVTTIQLMYKQVFEEYERMKAEYEKNPSEILQQKLQMKLQMVNRVEDQLRTIDSNHTMLSSASLTSSTSRSSAGDSLPPPPQSRPSSKRPSTGLNVVSDKSGSPDVVSQLPSFLHRGPKPWLPSVSQHWKPASLSAGVLKRDSKGSDAATVSRAEEADVEMVAASVIGTPAVESSSVPLSSAFSDPVSIISQDVSSRDAAESEVPSSANLQQPLKVSVLKPSLKVISPNQVKVVVMEDSDFTTVDDPGAFSDLMQLRHHPAHLAVFLHYLISNSDPAAMLFYFVTESYAQGTIKELRKWAYEIFSTFLCDQAPLKINVDEVTVTQVTNTLQTRHDQEEAMKNVFQSARIFAQNEINDHLTDFRSKRALGLGSLYGDHDLKDNMDRQSEMRIIENTLWKHFERFMHEEEVDRSQAMSSALATFFKQIGFTSQKNNSLLERCSSFNARDRKMFKFKSNAKKVIHLNGHQFITQHYFVTANCFHCQIVLWGIGNQGYQCTNCDINLHKNCVDVFKECCSSGSTLRKKKERRPPSMFDLISRKLSHTNPAAIKEAQIQHSVNNEPTSASPSVAAAAAAAAAVSIRQGLQETEEADATHRGISGFVGSLTESEKSQDEPIDQSPDDDDDDDYNSNTLSVGLGRSESLSQKAGLRASVRRTHSDVSPDNQVLTAAQRVSNISGSSSNSSSSLSARTSDSSEGLNDLSVVPPAGAPQKSQNSDSDFDVETELPLLESVIPKELFRKLKPKEKKRQEVINELFYTERTHVRNLKVLYHIFYQPMTDDPLAPLLFPNLGELIEMHCALNNELKTRKQESPVVGDFADILVKKFSGDEGDKFKMAAARFCQQQSHALEVLRQRQRKDQKMAAFLQDAVSNPLCRRLELKDLILTELQRLTKYPLLIESLLKYTVSNTEEFDQLVKAHDCSKELLNYVNQTVEESENRQKLVELQRRLDRRPIENSTHPVVSEYKKLDLTRHKMIYDGMLTWRINRSKHIDHHVVLLEDILVLLQRQDERLVLRCQSGSKESTRDDGRLPHSPIIKLNNLLTRNVAVDKRAFFLVSMSETIGPQIYELAAMTKDERNKWFKYITDAAEAYKAKDSAKSKASGMTMDEPQMAEAQRSTVDDLHLKTEDLAKARSSSHQVEDDRADADEKRNSNENLENLGRVEVLNFEPPQLVQPNEVKVSCMEVMEKLEPMRTPLDSLKEKNRLIEMTMLEKQKLLSKLLQIPVSEYEHIAAEVASEAVDQKDLRELLIGLLTKADELTNLINDALNASLESSSDAKSKDNTTLRPTVDGGEDDDVTPTPSPRVLALPGASGCQAEALVYSTDYQTNSKTTLGSTVVLPSSQLMSITSNLHRHLLRLLEVIVKKESEKDHQTSSKGVGRRPPITVVESSAEEEEEEEVVTASVEQPSCVRLSASLVTFPVVMEHVELIEVETIVPESFACTNFAPTEEMDSSGESAGVDVTSSSGKCTESNARVT